jgi:hypothetical protein
MVAVAPIRRRLVRFAPTGWWMRHLLEMVVAMAVGMQVIFGEYEAIAAAGGYRDAMTQLPELSTLVMAGAMVVPMALWMNHRGHLRRRTIEMAGAMGLPALVVLAMSSAGVVSSADLGSVYHAAMYAGMLGVMLFRRHEYSQPM